MDLNTKVVLLQTMLDTDVPEEILLAHLELAKGAILNRMYPFRENYDGLDVPDRYVGIQLKISNYSINKIGAEGQIQHIENGIHRNFGDADIPDSMLRDIVPYAQAIR